MKKILVTTAICLIGAASMMAQGRINFANSSSTPLRISNGVGGPTNVLGTASTAFYGIGPASMQIYLTAGLASSSLAPVMIGTAANALFVVNTASGIASAQGTFPGGSNLALAGFDGAAPVFLQLHAYSVTPGLWEGHSSIIQVSLATGVATATQVFNVNGGPNAWNLLNDMTIVPVPEPSSIVLAGLGAASLLMFRRRK